ncbi:transporter substrate-binding domain-containing protein [Phaeobacter sp. HF9A]|uniref:transporter substrate-binding domain-containing protein n=1 Tax=Phaeobacter sp. HF9A TaxID=2721561 RepID=UPI00142F56D5|nr:transporter substrate-binding domain-containing protein [Phaeobacter sp. HF9A]NIZ14089.1 transporter substrate-binding domain-containing protein [Phaeobacter sp. HF9A]
MQRILMSLFWRLLLVVGLVPSAAFAICDVDYVAQPGDNLFSIAEAHYGDRNRWTLIYYRNQGELAGPSTVPGRTLYIPCPPDAVEADATPLRKPTAEMNLLTGGNYAPFTDPNLPGQGMITELVNAALELAPSPVPYAITWEDDWSKHLFPLLDDKEFDMGFPWIKPDCEADPSNERCANFHFSDPLVEVPVMLFVRAGGGMVYAEDADVVGKTICRPKGFYTFDLDRADRRWLSEDKITLVQPDTPRDCMRMVVNGQVDAAAVNLFVGAEAVVAEGLRGQVEPLEKPISETGLHVVISKTHWRGTSHLYRVNAGLRKLRESGRFDEIMSRHLELFWATLQ